MADQVRMTDDEKSKAGAVVQRSTGPAGLGWAYCWVACVAHTLKATNICCLPACYCACQWQRKSYIKCAAKKLRRLTGLESTVWDAVFTVDPPCCGSPFVLSGTVEDARLYTPVEYFGRTEADNRLGIQRPSWEEAIRIATLEFTVKEGRDDNGAAEMHLDVDFPEGVTVILDTKNLKFNNTNFHAIIDKLQQSKVGQPEMKKQKEGKDKAAPEEGEALQAPAQANCEPEHKEPPLRLSSATTRGLTIVKVNVHCMHFRDDVRV